MTGRLSTPAVYFHNFTSVAHTVTPRKDWVATRDSLVTSGETGDNRERPVPGCDGPATQSTASARTHPITSYESFTERIPPWPPERGGG